MSRVAMNKKLSHTILFILDILCLAILWIAYNEIDRILFAIDNHVNMVSFGNRIGFSIAGVFLPLIHIIAIVEHYRPDFIKKHIRLLNMSCIISVVLIFSSGLATSRWIESTLQDAGYVYCRNASGFSALAKSLVFTRNADICKEVVAEKRHQP